MCYKLYYQIIPSVHTGTARFLSLYVSLSRDVSLCLCRLLSLSFSPPRPFPPPSSSSSSSSSSPPFFFIPLLHDFSFASYWLNSLIGQIQVIILRPWFLPLHSSFSILFNTSLCCPLHSFSFFRSLVLLASLILAAVAFVPIDVHFKRTLYCIPQNAPNWDE